LKPEGDIFADPSMIPHQLAGVFFVVAGDPEGNQFANFRGSDLRGVAHVLLWFAVVAFDVIKMNQIMPHVYRENRFSVDFEKNPMFAGVKQVSLFCERSELQEELGLRSDVNRACRQAPIDDCLAFGLGQPELGLGMQHLDLDGRVGSIAVGHGQAV
jgi:hypothetical protein